MRVRMCVSYSVCEGEWVGVREIVWVHVCMCVSYEVYNEKGCGVMGKKNITTRGKKIHIAICKT